MRYLPATVVCLAILAVYGLATTALGWQPGAIPLLILCAVLVAVWRAMTKVTPAAGSRGEPTA